MEKGLPTTGVKVDARLEDTAIDGEVFLFLHGEEGPKECTKKNLLFPQEKVQTVLYRTLPESTAHPAHPAHFHDSGRSLCAISQKSRPMQSIYQRPSTASGLLMVVGFWFCFCFLNKKSEVCSSEAAV